MNHQPPRKPAERRCTQCKALFPFAAYSTTRWNHKDRVCCNCLPFSGRKRQGKKVADKVRSESSILCKSWPLDGRVDKEETFFRYCAARKALRPMPDECYGCKVNGFPSNVGLL